MRVKRWCSAPRYPPALAMTRFLPEYRQYRRRFDPALPISVRLRQYDIVDRRQHAVDDQHRQQMIA
jgi:hypothetical protein